MPTGSPVRRSPRLFLHRSGFRIWHCWIWSVLLGLVLVWGGRSPIVPPAASQLTQPDTQRVRPAPRVHPLPPSLAQWHDRTGDYFDQIQPVSVGYLVWSRFPVTVFVQPVDPKDARSPEWVGAILDAVQEWNQYLPLQVVEQTATADISILRSAPPLKLETSPAATDPKTGVTRPRRLVLGRARSAETRFALYTQSDSNGTAWLSQRMTITLRPDQARVYLQAAARHELGHALGIWGHSRQITDALYFAQVRHPIALSPRDINTLKRVYEQPTQLGWKTPPAVSDPPNFQPRSLQN